MENKSIKVAITGAAGQIAYSLLPMLASGEIFGKSVKISLSLLDISYAEEVLKGVAMELEDASYPLLEIKYVGIDTAEAFKDSDLIIFLGGFPRKEGMERKELLKINSGIFEAQGKIMNDVVKDTCKILVVANPANSNCLTLAHYANKIPKKNYSCLTRLDQNRAVFQIAKKANVNIDDVSKVVIWGNHSSTQYPDIDHGTIKGEPIRKVINDDEFLKNDFISVVRSRGAAIIKARKLSSALSAAKAIVDHVRDWYLGSNGNWVSMGVISEESNYGVKSNLCFSFPVITKNFDYEIVQGLELDEYAKNNIKITEKELLEELSELELK